MVALTVKEGKNATQNRCQGTKRRRYSHRLSGAAKPSVCAGSCQQKIIKHQEVGILAKLKTLPQ